MISPGHEQHVDRVEAGDRGRAELGTGAQEVSQVGAENGRGAVEVDGDDRRPVGALVERQQVAGQPHHQRQHEQDHPDHPVQLARVLVGTEEEGPAHVEEDQDHHHRRAPLVHAAHEFAEEDVVGEVAHRLVGLDRGGRVVHRQEDPGYRLGDEGEQGRRAERVEPVRALRDLAEEHPGEQPRRPGALVDPADEVDPGVLGLRCDTVSAAVAAVGFGLARLLRAAQC